MKKGIKRILGLLLSISVICSLSMNLFAETPEYIDKLGSTAENQEDGTIQLEENLDDKEKSNQPKEEEYEDENDEEENPDDEVDGDDKDPDKSEENEDIKEFEEDDEVEGEKEEEEVEEIEEETEGEEEDEDRDEDGDDADEDEEKVEPEPIYLSLVAEVEPSRLNYTNGEVLDYTISLTNDGDVEVYSIYISDELGLAETIDIIYPGESHSIYGEYPISIYNEKESIENNINVYIDYDDEHLNMDLNFIREIYIPKGSITITNEVNYLDDNDLEFDILILGPNDKEYTVSLRDRETAIIGDLFIGDYTIKPIAPMNYSPGFKERTISLMENRLDQDIWTSYIQNSGNGFYNRNSSTSISYQANSINLNLYRSSMASFEERKRIAYVFLDLGIPESEEEKVEVEDEEGENLLIDNDDEEVEEVRDGEKSEVVQEPEEIILPVIPREKKDVEGKLLNEVEELPIKDEIKDTRIPDEIPILKGKEELNTYE